MSHPEQVGFFKAIVDANDAFLEGSSVLEVGSYDVNGTIRKLFAAAERYVGVDLVEGPGVDVVGFGHEIRQDDGSFDLTISSECFEHDPHWSETFANMVRMTRPGGLVAFSCAARGRPEHGTTRSDKTLSPGTQAVGLDYYRNLVESDFEQILPLDAMFVDYRFWYLHTHFDLYFAGIKAGDCEGLRPARLPEGKAIRNLASLMPLKHRAVRAPLRVLNRVIPEPKYQSLILPYWGALLRLTPDQRRHTF